MTKDTKRSGFVSLEIRAQTGLDPKSPDRTVGRLHSILARLLPCPTDISTDEPYLVGRCLSAPSESLWWYPWLQSERRRAPSTAAHSSVTTPPQASIATIVTDLKLCGDHVWKRS